MTAALEQFLDDLAALGVVPPTDVAALRAVLSGKAEPPTPRELADELVQQHRLTPFQADTICERGAEALVFGSYTLLEPIAAGGMGEVFKALHRPMERIVALKILPERALASPRASQRFQREMRAAARLSHPNIVTAYDAGEARGVHFLAMEYVEGRTLTAVVRKDGPLSVALALRHTLQAAAGLAHAHAAGVVHRDIKPTNLLLDKHGTVKILDMGLARLGIEPAEPADREGPPAATELTATGVVTGTVDFMAPEQAREPRDVDHRADIYSLGCTLHYLLTGRPPTPQGPVAEKLLWHQDGPVPSLRTLRRDVSTELDAVFQRMLARSPSDRYQTVEEVIGDLRACADASRETGGTAGLPGSAASPSAGGTAGMLYDSLSSTDETRDWRGDSTERTGTGGRQVGGAPGSSATVVHPPDDATRADARRPPSERRRRIARYAPLVILVGLAAGAAFLMLGPGEQEVPPEPEPLAESFENSAGMRFALVPAGHFWMGAGEAEIGASDDEFPRRHVHITRPFYLGVHEVTQGQYEAVMGVNPGYFSPAGEGSRATAALDTGRLPVENVSWYDADEFCRKLSDLPAERAAGRTYRLPTEAEWEYACRAGTITPFHYGEALASSQANFDGAEPYGDAPPGEVRMTTTPVGNFAPNDFGLYDMHGNVWEWCYDRYGAYRPEVQFDPRGAAGGSDRVLRGGAWFHAAAECRSAARNFRRPTHRSRYVGFRVVCETASP